MRRLAACLLVALVVLAIGAAGPARAVDFQCVEPSRYRNLLVVFNDDPGVLFSHFGLPRGALPDMELCRALLVTGTLREGDADALLDRIIQGRGWLAVLYLSIEGADIEEEARLAAIVRAFAIKTRAIRSPALSYFPDFAIPWEQPLPLTGTSAAPPPPREDVSPLNRGLRTFAERRDLPFKLDPARSTCNDGCRPVWSAGVNRLYNSSPPGAPVSTDIDARVIRLRGALAYHLDWERLPEPNAPVLKVPLGWASITPPAMARVLRERCSAELTVAESLQVRLAEAFGTAARNNLRPREIEALAPHFDGLSRAGARLQQCLAGTFESERLAAFQRRCTPACDRRTLSDSFAAGARDIIRRAGNL
jgi:hypothetical protein